jgi:sigma-B regulation protein RsbU (phosphoserine phosphatase)
MPAVVVNPQPANDCAKDGRTLGSLLKLQERTLVAKTTKQRKHLKLYTERPPKPPRPAVEAIAALPSLLSAFESATGWPVRFNTEQKSGKRKAESRLEVESRESRVESRAKHAENSQPQNPEIPASPINRESAERLACAIGGVLDELLDAHEALRRSEAELAAGVPLVPHREEEKHLAARLEAVLRAAAEIVDCDAAALYMLDEGTTRLKLRSAWGLPPARLGAAARPLQGAVADLEALLGHAVVLDDAATMRAWNPPEDFVEFDYSAAVCLPVSTPTVLLGTLWIFGRQRRDFNDRETNMLEVAAGRLAAELEREMLLRTSIDGAGLRRQLDAAERMQRNELPAVAPLLDGWQTAGWTEQAGAVGGAMHDWFSLPNGYWAAAVGRAEASGMAGALAIGSLKSALRSHAQYQNRADRLLRQANLTLWTGSAGDRRAELLLALVENQSGRVCLAAAGRPSAVLLHRDGWQSLSQSGEMLGAGTDGRFAQFGCELRPGEALILFTESVRDSAEQSGRVLGEIGLAEALRDKHDLTAEELLAAAREALENHSLAAADRSILVVKRTTD